MTAANHNTSHHKVAFVATANAIPVGEDGKSRNGPPKTNHQMITPGCTKSKSGSRRPEEKTSAELSRAKAPALAITNTTARTNHHRPTEYTLWLTTRP